MTSPVDTPGHDEAYAALGAFVLGALDDQERERVAKHVAACPACRQDVADLQVAADVLPQGVEPVTPPPELKDRIMAVVRSEADLLHAAGPEADRPGRAVRREASRSRWLLRPAALAFGAAAVLAIGVGAGVLVSGGDDGPAGTRTIQASVRPAAGADAGARLVVARDSASGARLEVQGMRNPPPGRVYQVWIAPSAGAPVPTDALFTVSRAGTASVSVPGSLAGAQAVLVTSEPQGGSRVPSGQPVIAAKLT
ncbi:MAG: anti-sigma factor [Solirubrobacteraceae bacterium]